MREKKDARRTISGQNKFTLVLTCSTWYTCYIKKPIERENGVESPIGFVVRNEDTIGHLSKKGSNPALHGKWFPVHNKDDLKHRWIVCKESVTRKGEKRLAAVPKV